MQTEPQGNIVLTIQLQGNLRVVRIKSSHDRGYCQKSCSGNSARYGFTGTDAYLDCGTNS